MTASVLAKAVVGEMRSEESNSIKKTVPLHLKEDKKDAVGRRRRRVAQQGDVVTIEFNLTPENDFVPHPLFDTNGVVSFVVGWGNYLPGLHTLIKGMSVGEEIQNVSVDAGWGERNPELMVRILKKKLSKSLSNINLIRVGTRLYLEGGIQVIVTEVSDDTITVDGNRPLAGASYACDLKLLAIEDMPASLNDTQPSLSSSNSNRYQVATFALGCFWGAELAFMRIPGVVGTRVGYSQGHTADPTYEEVSTGTTQHREAIEVVYDSRIVTYASLIQVAMDRLDSTTTMTSFLFATMDEEEENSRQYRHGVYFHTQEQRLVAQQKFRTENHNKYQVEVKPARAFYVAEDYHQQYLLKGGQSARKGTKEPIRCFG